MCRGRKKGVEEAGRKAWHMQGVLVEAERKSSKRECQEEVVEGRKDW